MGIESKHAYRFVFLRSEKWSNVRLEALGRETAKCQICGEEDISNDAHHISYPPSVWDTKEDDLVILCRICHDLAHKIFIIKRPKKESMSDFVELVNALRVWKNKKYGDEYHKPPRVLAREMKELKIPKCMVCGRSGVPLSKINILERYDCLPQSGKDWNFCEECKTSAIMEIKWTPTQYGVWPEIRKWLEQRKLKFPSPTI